MDTSMHLINFNDQPPTKKTYAGMAGDKLGICYNHENWFLKSLPQGIPCGNDWLMMIDIDDTIDFTGRIIGFAVEDHFNFRFDLIDGHFTFKG